MPAQGRTIGSRVLSGQQRRLHIGCRKGGKPDKEGTKREGQDKTINIEIKEDINLSTVRH